VVAVAELEQLNAEGVVGVDAADDATGAEGGMVDLKAKIERVAGNVASGEVRLKQAAVEAEIEDASPAEVPVVNAKVSGTAAGVARCAAALIGWQRHLLLLIGYGWRSMRAAARLDWRETL
jgi:molybdenum cofactor biosynthesis enzyme